MNMQNNITMALTSEKTKFWAWSNKRSAFHAISIIFKGRCLNSNPFEPVMNISSEFPNKS